MAPKHMKTLVKKVALMPGANNVCEAIGKVPADLPATAFACGDCRKSCACWVVVFVLLFRCFFVVGMNHTRIGGAGRKASAINILHIRRFTAH